MWQFNDRLKNSTFFFGDTVYYTAILWYSNKLTLIIRSDGNCLQIKRIKSTSLTTSEHIVLDFY